ncbi:hypothetical protein SAMN05428997_105232 [Bosea sp. CRIB-10]|uniref:DUF2059 domain-containing protein n=1 Tax=Bosea sp. CRIB-10 TaxID=378404 RepID=UPI0008E871B9|nr:DUF2059 domain-containing protein [Bosea sp. CRIB-10]SFC29307.1 hypothetical protein SAMN05428997_105232 [Bosea sp. CRIB-10]
MIRHSLAGALLSLALLAMPALAQQGPTPEHLKAAREVVISSGLSQSFDSIYAEFTAGVRQSFGTTRPELKKDMDEVLTALKAEADLRREEIVDSSARIFASKMTEADLKDVAAFFNSPVGQRYNSYRPQVIDEIFALLQPWSTATSNRLFDLFQAEMRKRGHQL